MHFSIEAYVIELLGGGQVCDVDVQPPSMRSKLDRAVCKPASAKEDKCKQK